MPVQVDSCPICSHTTFAETEPFQDDHIDTFYVACEECGLVMMNPRPSEEEVAAFYASSYWSERRPLEESFRKQGRFGKHISQFVAKHLESTGKKEMSSINTVLEVGASFGATLDTVRSCILDDGGKPNMFAIEPSSEAREAGAKLYESITVIGRRLEELPDHPDLRFDLIILSHVLEHLFDPVEAIKILGQSLADGGVLFVEVPNYYGHPSLEYVHNYCFTETSFRNCIQAAGLECATLDINGHHEAFPFYLSALAVKRTTDSPSIQNEPIGEIATKRAAAREAFQAFREGNPRDT